jgi:hypothetical protein
MKHIGLLLLLLIAASPAFPASYRKITVQQLSELLTSLQNAKKTDEQVATELKRIELTEELTASSMQKLPPLIPGPLSTEQIYVLEARSAMLPPPAADLPTAPAPDPAAQQALLAKAQDYVTKTYSQLPQLTATRMLARFQDGVEAVHTYSGMNQGLAQDSDPLWQTTSANVRLINTRTTLIESANGIEKPPVEKDKTQWGPNNMVASLGATLSLATVIQEARANGNPTFLRWELIEGKQMAVFAFSVDKKKTHFGVNYCCFPSSDTAGVLGTGVGISQGAGAGGTGTLQTTSEWKPFKAGSGYRGEIFIDPDLGIVIRTVTEAQFKPTDFVHAESIRTDYAPVTIGGKVLVVPIRSFTTAEIVPNGDSFAAKYAVRHTFVTQDFKDYQLAGK